MSVRIIQRDGHACVVRDLECISAAHAGRYDEVLRRSVPGYFALLAEVVEPFALTAA